MQQLRIVVSVVVMTVWAALYVRAVIDPSFHPPAEITGVALLAVGFLLGANIIQIGKQNGGKRNGV